MGYKIHLEPQHKHVAHKAVEMLSNFYNGEIELIIRTVIADQTQLNFDSNYVTTANMNSLVVSINESHKVSTLHPKNIQIHIDTIQDFIKKHISGSEKVAERQKCLHCISKKLQKETSNIFIPDEYTNDFRKALDFYSRLCTGQIEEMGSEIRMKCMGHLFSQSELLDYEHVLQLKRSIFPQLSASASMSIGSPQTPKNAQIAYELCKIFTYKEVWDKNPKGGFGANFQLPLNYSGEKIPTIETVRETSQGKKDPASNIKIYDLNQNEFYLTQKGVDFLHEKINCMDIETLKRAVANSLAEKYCKMDEKDFLLIEYKFATFDNDNGDNKDFNNPQSKLSKEKVNKIYQDCMAFIDSYDTSKLSREAVAAIIDVQTYNQHLNRIYFDSKGLYALSLPSQYLVFPPVGDVLINENGSDQNDEDRQEEEMSFVPR